LVTMANVTVTLGDKSQHTYENVPEGITPEQVHERAAKEFNMPVLHIAKDTVEENPIVSYGKEVLGNVSNLYAGIAKGAVRPLQMIGEHIAPETTENVSQYAKNKLVNAGFNPESTAYNVGTLAGETAITAPVAGILGGTAKVLNAAPKVVNLLRTGGMTGDIGSNAIANFAARTGAGAVTNAASEAMLHPEDVKNATVIGAVMPTVGKLVKGLHRFVRGAEQTPVDIEAIKKAKSLGLVIPPATAKQSIGNEIIEGLGGKTPISQIISKQNQPVFNALAAKAINLPEGTKLDFDTLSAVRNEAGKAYSAIGDVGIIKPKAEYVVKLDKIAEPFLKSAQGFPDAPPSPVINLIESLKSPAFDSSAAIAKIKQLRTAADDAFRTNNTDVAKASKAAARALEDAVESHLQDINAPELLDKFKQAREMIARTYDIEKTLAGDTGNVSARKFADLLKRKRPIDGELKDIASFASMFPKASQEASTIGSIPTISLRDVGVGGLLSLASGQPLLWASALAKPAARALASTPIIQRNLVQKPPLPLDKIAPTAARASTLALANQLRNNKE
jgi:hypothetical protein